VAGALELIHTYSLVHDDLPAMDDDDFRRGQLSCHRRFGEATAILAGDALLTLAFGQLASESSFPPALMKDLIGRIARSAGSSGGMIAGQMMDLDAEGGPLEPGLPEAIHAAKTGALFEASVIAGALLGGGDRDQVEVLGRFGRTLGLAFQVRDDMLDELGAEETLGKTPGKDRRQGKATYARLYGIEASREEVSRLTGKARESLAFLGERGALLDAVARELETRGR
jgi:geranylgeranyl pyrophosphate synthase